MPPYQELGEVLPPLILGVGVFNHQFNSDPSALPSNAIVLKALQNGICAFDTSPYYGPSEDILGHALAAPEVTRTFAREDYYILTKVGRIAASEFDYSPTWIRHSVQRSLARLRTSYLDVVYCHDVEFVSPAEVLAAVRELRRIRDETGAVRKVGVSGYPLDVLCELAELVQRETGEALDIVQSYCHQTLQNTRLGATAVQRLRRAGVRVVPNASPLGMGLMRSAGVPIGAMGDFHPSSMELRQACLEAAKVCEAQGERLETVALRYAMQTWIRDGREVGTSGALPSARPGARGKAGHGVGITVLGCSYIDELDQALATWRSLLLDIGIDATQLDPPSNTSDWSTERIEKVERLAEDVRQSLSSFIDQGWDSPAKDYVNTRVYDSDPAAQQ